MRGPNLATSPCVECLIEVVDRSDHRIVRLAGRLAEAQVPELFRVCADTLSGIELDLANLISVDPVGLDALDRLRQRGAALTEVPAYIQLKLDSASSSRRGR